MKGKNVRIGGKWRRIELTKEEEVEVKKQLLKENIKEMERCINAGVEIIGNIPEMKMESLEGIVLALFEKQATASYTALSDALEKKVNEVKGG